MTIDLPELIRKLSAVRLDPNLPAIHAKPVDEVLVALRAINAMELRKPVRVDAQQSAVSLRVQAANERLSRSIP